MQLVSYMESSYVIKKKNIGRDFDQRVRVSFRVYLGLWDLRALGLLSLSTIVEVLFCIRLWT